jgi:hypothetical protein
MFTVTTCERVLTKTEDSSFSQAAQTRKISTSPEESVFYKVTYDPDEVCLLSQTSPFLRDDTKVQVKPDRRDLADLSSNFRHHVSIEVLTRVWESNNQAWDACFDVLSAWLASHGPALVSLDQLDFLLDSQSWPCLPSPRSSLPQLTSRLALLALSRASSLSGSGSGSTSDGWSFCGCSDDNDEGGSDAGEGWVQVDMLQVQGEETAPSVPPAAASAAAPRRSFRDVLLLASPHSPSSSSSPPFLPPSKRPRSGSSEREQEQERGQGQGRVWRPQIVCVRLQARHRHRDVVYMDSDEVLGE